MFARPSSSSAIRSFSSYALRAKEKKKPRWISSEVADQEASLPRWQRRALQFGQPEDRPQNSLPLNPKQSRKNHKNIPRSQDPNTILQPATLSARISKLCEMEKIDEAIEMLKTSPLDAQNTPVWNTIIWECMRKNRFALAHKLYTEMKRRGFSPTIRTFLTMFRGMSRIGENWHLHTVQLAHARTLYDTYCRYISSVSKHEPDSDMISAEPLAPYIKLLADAGQFEEAMTVFADIQEPLRPDHLIFTAIFEALTQAGKRMHAVGSMNRKVNLLDAATVWEQAVKASEQPKNFTIDSHLVTAAINALSSGRGRDYDLGFSLAKEFYGFVIPGESKVAGQFQLGPSPLHAILSLCFRSGRAQPGLDFFEHIQKRPELSNAVDIGHVQQMIELYAQVFSSPRSLEDARARLDGRIDPTDASSVVALIQWSLQQAIILKKGSKLFPNHSCYVKALKACLAAKDWTSATKIFDLMTGYHCHDFADGVNVLVPRRTQRPAARTLQPDPEIFSFMMQVAQSTQNRAAMRQAIRLFERLGLPSLQSETVTRRLAKDRAFHVSKIAESVNTMVDSVMSSGSSNKPEEVDRWFKLAGQLLEATSQKYLEGIPPSKKKKLAESKFPKKHPRVDGSPKSPRPSTQRRTLTIKAR